jgi:hypothetical protein
MHGVHDLRLPDTVVIFWLMTIPGSRPNPKRRWLQFSVRGLFLLVLVFALPLGWLAWAMNTIRQERLAVAALRNMDCKVSAPYNTQGSLTILERLRKLLGEDQFRNATQVSGTYWYTHSKITDGGLVHLQGLTQLQQLYLHGTQVTDAGLAHLEGLTQLKELRLDGTQVTDAGLVHLRRLTQLQWLVLPGQNVTDAGVRKLQNALPNCHIMTWQMTGP